jgi:hypothetical protein
MENNELRAAFIEILSRDTYPTDIEDLVFQISLFCLEKNFINGEEIVRNFNSQRYKIERVPGALFEENYWAEISSIFWEFVANGTIAVGLGSDQNKYNLRRFTITNYGKNWLKNKKEPIPENADNYLEYMKSSIINIDEIVIQYINEALKTFNDRYIFASAVMIGAAAEKIIYLLAEKIKDLPLNSILKNKIKDALELRRLKSLLDSVSEAINFLIPIFNTWKN